MPWLHYRKRQRSATALETKGPLPRPPALVCFFGTHAVELAQRLQSNNSTVSLYGWVQLTSASGATHQCFHYSPPRGNFVLWISCTFWILYVKDFIYINILMYSYFIPALFPSPQGANIDCDRFFPPYP